MLVRLIRQDGYVTLDRATVRAGAGADPDGFVAGLPVPVALDEVQWVPDLLLAVKAEIDEHRELGRFLLMFLTGMSLTAPAHQWLIHEPGPLVSGLSGRRVSGELADRLPPHDR
jgi:hypothetical protein